MENALKFSFFEGFESPLSTVRFSDFELDGRKFNSAEQCFQFHKAEFFQSNDLALKITEDGVNPLEARRLGSSLDTSQAGPTWPDYAKLIMERACTAKFKQNDGLRKYLFKTKGSHLVYCNPKDLFWSNGLRKTHMKRSDPSYWLGLNQLGKILVQVREALMKDPTYKNELDNITKEQEINKRKYTAKMEKSKIAKLIP